MASREYTDDELRVVLDAFAACDTKVDAAKMLGLPATTFTSKLKRAQQWEKMGGDLYGKIVDDMGVDPSAVKMVWCKDKDHSIRLDFKGEVQDLEEISDRICAEIERKSPKFKPVKYQKGDHLLVITPADIHFGKLSLAYETGDEYNIQIAEERTRQGVSDLLQIGQMFGLEAITINTGNDSLHVDNTNNTTTAGTKQDTDKKLFDMFDAAFWTWVWVIEQAATIAPVHVVFDPSNHPWVSDWMLNRAVMAFFTGHSGVTFDIQMQNIRHRKYQVYGSSLIGYTHGDGAKDKDLPALMQHEQREWWGKTKRGYWLTKHKHHKDRKAIGLQTTQMEKDHIGVTVINAGSEHLDKNISVEVIRSPSGTDGWHDRNAYVGAIKAIEAFLFHVDDGQVARFTRPFK